MHRRSKRNKPDKNLAKGVTNITTRSRANVDHKQTTTADQSVPLTLATKMGSNTISDDIRDLVTKTINEEIKNFSESLTSSFTENEELRNKIESLENRLRLTEGLLTQAQTKIKMQDEKNSGSSKQGRPIIFGPVLSSSSHRGMKL